VTKISYTQSPSCLPDDTRSPCQLRRLTHDAKRRSLGFKRNAGNLKEFIADLALGSGYGRDRRTRERSLDARVVQPGGRAAANDDMHASRQDLADDDPIPVLAIHAYNGLFRRELPVGEIGHGGLEGARQFASVIAIASPTKGSQPLPGVHLQHGGARPDHFSASSSLVARGTERIQAATRRRKRWITGQCPLTCGFTGTINIEDQIAASSPIPDSTDRVRGPPPRKG